MHPEAREKLGVRFRYTVLQIAANAGIGKNCGEFNVPRSTFYEWKSRFDQEGKAGLCRKNTQAIPIHRN